MRKIRIGIKGTGQGLLMNSPAHMMENISIDKEISKGFKKTKYPSLNEQAHKSAYWMGKGKKRELYIPSECIFRSMINASSFHKVGKKSARTILAGALLIQPDKIGLGTNKYNVDVRTVVIQKARILKARANVKKWEVNFEIIYNEKMIGDSEILKIILAEAGERIGILDFRPQKSGQFGTFEISKWLPSS